MNYKSGLTLDQRWQIILNLENSDGGAVTHD
ncbi:hypothetical protein CCACVL1_10684 [Corchorus capsularis]|uniref:Uncharacterized protein n=1 Tax=Corchorus capsularis TaxID=210143 RepID=A0A1R3IQ82_COCAP|nr:hypothetical protein CCACVL1_10684 [Corchorus capsularis]